MSEKGRAELQTQYSALSKNCCGIFVAVVVSFFFLVALRLIKDKHT